MKHSVFRGFLLGCFAMLAAVFTISMPATASAEPIVQGYELQLFAEHNVVTPEHVAILAEDPATSSDIRRSTIETGPLHPVYALSHRTDGHSIDAAFHLRL